MPPPLPSARPPRLVTIFAGVALLGYALVAPSTGVDRDLVARAHGLRGGLDLGMSSLWLLSARLVAVFPLGDFAARLRLISLLAGAAAVALMLWRSLSVRPGDGTGVGIGSASVRTPVEIVAALWGVTTVAVSRSFVTAATSAGPSAVGAVLALAVLTLAERLARAPGDRRSGLWLAFVAGLAAGGPLAAAALGWPIAALVLLRALRRAAVGGRLRGGFRDRPGHGSADALGGGPRVALRVNRWPALAAACLIAGVGIGVAVMSQAAGSADLSVIGARVILLPVFHALAHLSTGALASAVAELGDQVGVLAAMVAVAGLSSLRRTSLIFTVWSLAAGLVLRAAFGAGTEGALGIMLAATAMALPLGAGIVRLAARLGRARLPAAAALGIIVATWPFLAQH